MSLCQICHGYNEVKHKNVCICPLWRALERLKIERDAIIRNASNTEIKYNKSIEKLRSTIHIIRAHSGHECNCKEE